jgi:hypothetical protein
MSLTESTCALGAAKKSILANVLLKREGELRSRLRNKALEGLRLEQIKGG